MLLNGRAILRTGQLHSAKSLKSAQIKGLPNEFTYPQMHTLMFETSKFLILMSMTVFIFLDGTALHCWFLIRCVVGESPHNGEEPYTPCVVAVQVCIKQITKNKM